MIWIFIIISIYLRRLFFDLTSEVFPIVIILMNTTEAIANDAKYNWADIFRPTKKFHSVDDFFISSRQYIKEYNFKK